jgi:hypothetical protein
MTSKISKTVLLALAACAMQAQVMAVNGLMGKLKTRDNKPVTVNGNKATSGTTLLSGSQIQCPDKIGATIDLGALGRIDMAPNSDITVTFNAGSVSVQLRKGFIVLSTTKGINGTVTNEEGTVFQTDSSKASSVVAKSKDAVGPEAAAAGAKGGLGAGAAYGVAGAGAAVVGGAAAAKGNGRGSDLSGDNPRKP